MRELVLLADSSPLFAAGGAWLQAVVALSTPVAAARPVYVGASNGDNPDYFEIFRAAFESVGVHASQIHHIHTPPSDAEVKLLENSSLVLLSGGDTAAGWMLMQACGLAPRIQSLYSQGRIQLWGVSAGACQICHFMEGPDGRLEPALALAPFSVTVHNERAGWLALKRLASALPHAPGAAETPAPPHPATQVNLHHAPRLELPREVACVPWSSLDIHTAVGIPFQGAIVCAPLQGVASVCVKGCVAMRAGDADPRCLEA